MRVGNLIRPNEAGRNLRSVWEITTQPYPEAHFAVFPEKIPERCILAATSEKGNCTECGKPWVRVVEKPDMSERPIRNTDKADGQHPNVGWDGFPRSAGQEYQDWRDENPNKTLGWKPQCTCEVPSEPPVVLDPFSGSGTTLWVAKRLGRRAIGIDTSSKYCDLAVERNRQQSLL